MDRLRKIVCCLVLFCGFMLVQAEEAPSLQPIKIGTIWHYQAVDQKEKQDFWIKAAKEEKIGDQLCIKLEGIMETENEKKVKVKEIVSTEHIAIKSDGIYRYALTDNKITPPLCICKLPPKNGNKWSQSFTIEDKKGSADYTQTLEEVIVKAGKYTNAVKVGVNIEENSAKTTLNVWYAPGVGIVKQIFSSGKETFSLELQDVEIPKK